MDEEYKKIIKRGKNMHEEPPLPFRKNMVVIWAIFGIIGVPILLFILVGSQNDNNREDAQHLLLNNAEILTVMLTVTLGITLIGLQFRAQSYTMIGLIEYIKDKVVYAFIGVVIGNTMFNIVAAAIIDETNYEWAVAISIVGAFASLLYYAGYIYHVIYKLQHSQIFNDNYEKMGKNEFKESSDKDMDEKIDEKIKKVMINDTPYDINIEPFKIWEDMMIRADNVRDLNMFTKEINRMFDMLEVKLKHNDSERGYAIKNIIFGSINTVMLFHIEQYNRNFMKIMTEALSKREKYLIESIHHDKDLQLKDDWKYDLWNNMWRMMTISISNNNGTTFDRNIGITMNILRKTFEMNGKQESKKVIDFASRLFSDIIESCIEQNRYRLMGMFLSNFEKRDFITVEYDSDEFKNWWGAIFNIMGRIMRNAASNNDKNAFENNIGIIMSMLYEIIKKEHSEEESANASHLINYSIYLIDDIVEYCNEQKYHRSVRMLLLKILKDEYNESSAIYSEDIKDGNIMVEIIENIMKNAINTKNESMLIRYVGIIQNIPGDGQLKQRCIDILRRHADKDDSVKNIIKMEEFKDMFTD